MEAKIGYYDDPVKTGGWHGWIELGGGIIYFRSGELMIWGERTKSGAVKGTAVTVSLAGGK